MRKLSGIRLRKRTTWLAGGLAIVAAGALASAAMAEPVGDPVASPISAEPAGMWQANNVVWAMEYHAGVVFAGGSFSSVRPPGVAVGGAGQVAQGDLAAFNASTGSFVSTWRPTFNGEVDTLDVSPDGTRLYVGGSFTQVNGQARQRIAVFSLTNPTNPTLLPTSAFNGRVNRKVYSIAASNTTVYAAGAFTQANGTPRTLAASFAANGGALNAFDPSITDVQAGVAAPFATSVSIGDGRVYVGGQFETVNGVHQPRLAVVDASTGASIAGFNVPIQPDDGGWVTDVLYYAPANTLFVVGRVPPARSPLRLEGIMAMDATSGAIKWGSNGHRCLGDSFDLMVFDGIVWDATHGHDCSQVGTFHEQRPAWHGAVFGQDINTGEQVAFYPQISGKTSVAGSMDNARALTNDGTNMFVGGGFTQVDGFGAQQNLIKFVPKNGTGGIAPAKPAKPTATSSGGTVTVSWAGVFDRDDRALTYQVLRGSSNTPVDTIQADSPWWNEPTLTFTDTGVTTGASVTYRIRVSDGSNSVTSNASTAVIVQ
jgi:hypothetical protein